MSPVFLPFNANLTSIKRWYLNFKWQFRACQVNNQIVMCLVHWSLITFVQEQQHMGPLRRNGFLADARRSCKASSWSLEQNGRNAIWNFEHLKIKFHAFDITDQCQYQKVLWDVSRSCHMISQQWISWDLIKLWDLKSLMRINRILWELCHYKSHLWLE